MTDVRPNKGMTERRRKNYSSFKTVEQISLRARPVDPWTQIKNVTRSVDIGLTQHTLSGDTYFPYVQSLLRSDNSGLREMGKGLSRRDLGSDFYTAKSYVEYSHPDYKLDFLPNSQQRLFYSGPVWLTGNTNEALSWPKVPFLPLTDASLFAKGGDAIRATMPERPDTSLLVMLGELKHGAPRIVPELYRDRTRFFKSLGSDYLNVEFGWKPFINDLRSELMAVRNHDRILTQFVRNSERPMKRAFTFPEVVTSSTTTRMGSVVSPADYRFFASGGSQGTRTVTSKKSERVWFRGRYRYFLPDREISRYRDREAKLNRLLGTRLTPDVLWELTPWSWLIDWVVDIGGFFESLSTIGQDGLLLDYGYLMRTARWEEIHSQAVSFSSGRTELVTETLGNITKLRTHASPYGFGVNFDGLSPKQLAILAALGVSRGSKDSW